MWQSNSFGRQVVEKTIQNVETTLGFNSKRMLLRMALVESNFGNHPDTFNPNFVDHTDLHSIGIWQITEMCLNETKNNPNLTMERKRIMEAFEINWNDVSMNDMLKPLHNCLTAYLYIKFAEQAWNEAAIGWPDDLPDQAMKWKYHFNRNPRGLSVDGFVNNCNNNGV